MFDSDNIFTAIEICQEWSWHCNDRWEHFDVVKPQEPQM